MKRKIIICILVFLLAGCSQPSVKEAINTDQATLDALVDNFQIVSIDTFDDSGMHYSVVVSMPYCIVQWRYCTTDYLVISYCKDMLEERTYNSIDDLVTGINELRNGEW